MSNSKGDLVAIFARFVDVHVFCSNAPRLNKLKKQKREMSKTPVTAVLLGAGNRGVGYAYIALESPEKLKVCEGMYQYAFSSLFN